VPKITDSIADFARSHNAQTIFPLPDVSVPELNQRGPSCGFFALGFVLRYWHERQKHYGGEFNLNEPVNPRTKPAPSKNRSTEEKKEKKREQAKTGTFSSLRHFGKYYKLTRYGSMFNAESIVRAARGEGSQWAGQYDGKVLKTEDPDKMIAKISALLDVEVPVITPWDCDDYGDPTKSSGLLDAHWSTIAGYYNESTVRHFIHYHWGSYWHCPAKAMAESCHQLTSNALLEFVKMEAPVPLFREYTTDKYAPRGGKEISPRGFNLEFCDPQSLPNLSQTITTMTTEDLRKGLKEHGFDPDNLVNAGLRRNIVPVYPTAIAAELTSWGLL
jgi:hypothetical protein